MELTCMCMDTAFIYLQRMDTRTTFACPRYMDGLSEAVANK